MSARRQALLATAFLGLAAGACTVQNRSPEAPGAEEARLVALASDIQRRGDARSALPLFERAVQVSGNRPQANVRLGTARLDAGDPEAAQAAFRAALDREPGNAAALLGLGTAQLRAGEVDAAARSLGEAAPAVRSASAFNRYGTALMLKGDGAGAEAAFAQAAKLEPANLDTQSNLALAKALSGKAGEGVDVMARVTASPRAQARHFRNRMLVLVLAGRDAEAASVVVPDYPDAERRRFIAEARKVNAVKDTAGRARAVGLLAAG